MSLDLEWLSQIHVTGPGPPHLLRWSLVWSILASWQLETWDLIDLDEKTKNPALTACHCPAQQANYWIVMKSFGRKQLISYQYPPRHLSPPPLPPGDPHVCSFRISPFQDSQINWCAAGGGWRNSTKTGLSVSEELCNISHLPPMIQTLSTDEVWWGCPSHIFVIMNDTDNILPSILCRSSLESNEFSPSPDQVQNVSNL